MTQPNSGEEPKTIAQRQDAAEAALYRDIQKARENHLILMVPKTDVPSGTTLAECYETEKEWVIVGEPNRCEDEKDPNYHNCDAMGCSTLCHVVARIRKDQPGQLSQLRAERDTWERRYEHASAAHSGLSEQFNRVVAERDRLKKENEKHEGYRVSLRHRYQLAADERDRLAAEVERLKAVDIQIRKAIAATGATESEGSTLGQVISVCDLLTDRLTTVSRLTAELEAAKGERDEAAVAWAARVMKIVDQRDALAAKVRELIKAGQVFVDATVKLRRWLPVEIHQTDEYHDFADVHEMFATILSTPPDEGECNHTEGYHNERKNTWHCTKCGGSWSGTRPPPPNPEGAGEKCPSCGSEFVDGNGSKRCPKCLSHVAIPNSGEKPLSVTEYAETARDAVRMPDTQGREKEYRMLAVWETIQDGDQVRNSTGWRPVVTSIGRPVHPSFHGHFRRPITPPTETEKP